MNLYTFYSPSHKEIYEDFFLKSFNEHLSNDFNLIVETNEQITSDGSFSDPKATAVWGDKVQLLKKAIDENQGKWFVYSDCDIQFFGNIMEDLEKNIDENIDMVCQEDYHTICAGFMAIKASDKMKKFIEIVEINHHQSNDQIAMNQFRNLINYRFLPKERYYTVGNFNGGVVWNAGDRVPNVENAVMHHANFTIGVENKIAMLKEVRNIIG